jgi:hypothetical protein
MSREKTSMLATRCLTLQAFIILTGLQITHDMYLNGYFMLLFDLTTDRSASAGHKSHLDNGVVRIELRYSKPLPEAITCLLYLEYNSSNRRLPVTTD